MRGLAGQFTVDNSGRAGPAGTGTSRAASACAASRCQDRHSAAYAPPAATSSSCEPSSVIRPSSTTATRSASCAEKSRCAIAMTVRPVQHRGQRALQMPGGPRVDQRGRLVEHQRVRVGEHQPGQRQLLRLRRRERWLARAELGLEPGRQSAPRPARRPPPARPGPRPSSRPGRASATFSRSVPRKTWCSWVTRATCSAQFVQRQVDQRTRRPHVTVPVRGRGRPRAAGPGWTCRRRTGPRWPAAHPGAPSARPRAAHPVRPHRSSGRRRRRGARRPAAAAVGATVVGDLGDAEQPGQRGLADLQLVQPRQHPVHRVDQLLHVERRRGDLAQRDPALA